jgi:hypothetical protein
MDGSERAIHGGMQCADERGMQVTVESHRLDVTDHFRPTVGKKLLKSPSIKQFFCGRPSDATALHLKPPWRRAELPCPLAPP